MTGACEMCVNYAMLEMFGYIYKKFKNSILVLVFPTQATHFTSISHVHAELDRALGVVKVTLQVNVNTQFSRVYNEVMVCNIHQTFRM